MGSVCVRIGSLGRRPGGANERGGGATHQEDAEHQGPGDVARVGVLALLDVHEVDLHGVVAAVDRVLRRAVHVHLCVCEDMCG